MRPGLTFFLTLGSVAIVTAAHSASIPLLDYTATCKATPPVAMDQKQTLNSCLVDEKRAKADLQKQWDRSKQEWKTSCLRQTTLGNLPSYVELITCLEMHDPNPPSLDRVGASPPATPAAAGGTPPAAGDAGKRPKP